MSGPQELFKLKKEEKTLLEKELALYKNSNIEIAKELSEIRQKHNDMVEKNIKLCRENADLNKEINELQKMNEDIKQALELLENSEKSGQNSKAQCEGLLEALSNCMSFYKDDILKELTTFKKLEECQVKRKEWESKLADIENIIAESEKRNNEDIDKKEAEIQQVMDKIKKDIQRKAEVENESMQLRGHCAEMKKVIENKTKEILELQSYKAELHSQMAAFKIMSK